MKLLATILKELKLLFRDKVALLILIILPVCLVFLVSLTQSNMGGTQESINLLYLNKDKGTIGKAMNTALAKQNHLKLIPLKQSSKAAIKKAKEDVAKGKYNGFLYIPRSVTTLVKKNTERLLSKKTVRAPKIIELYIDPSMLPSTVSSLKVSMQHLLQAVQLKVTQKILASVIHTSQSKTKKSWFKLEQHYASATGKSLQPNSVQQNVPAWALFGMFFIVIPLAGLMIQERSQGVTQRLRIAPVSPITLLFGRTVCYILLNIIQLFLMLLVGVYLLPLFDLPTLNLATHIPLVLLVGICASCAAIGFGILVGSWATSYQQAIILGPFIIVIAAAISGIFVPIYIMPDYLKYISEASPLYWAQKSFINVFVRNAGIADIWPDLLKLIGFFVLMLLLSASPITKKLANRKIK